MSFFQLMFCEVDEPNVSETLALLSPCVSTAHFVLLSVFPFSGSDGSLPELPVIDLKG